MLRSDVSLDGQERDSKRRLRLVHALNKILIMAVTIIHVPLVVYPKRCLTLFFYYEFYPLLPALQTALVSVWSVRACISACLQLVTAAF